MSNQSFKKQLFSIVVTTFLLFFCFETKAELKIRACFENWPPYYSITADETLIGPVFEVLQEIAHLNNGSIEFVELPYKRCLEEVRKNRFDMVLLSSPGIAGVIESKTPLAYWNLMAVVNEASTAYEYRNMRQFTDKRVGTFAGYLYPKRITEGRKFWASETKVTYHETTDGSHLRIFRLIERNRIDVAFLDLAWVKGIVQKNNLAVKILYPPVHSDPSMIGYAPHRIEIIKLFESELSRLSISGRLDILYKERLGLPLSAF